MMRSGRPRRPRLVSLATPPSKAWAPIAWLSRSRRHSARAARGCGQCAQIPTSRSRVSAAPWPRPGPCCGCSRSAPRPALTPLLPLRPTSSRRACALNSPAQLDLALSHLVALCTSPSLQPAQRTRPALARHASPPAPPANRSSPARRRPRGDEPSLARHPVQHHQRVEGAQAPRGQEPLCRHGRRVRRDVLVHDLRARRHQVRRPSSSSSCLVLARELFVDTLLTYSVANVPATSITGGTQAGQDGTAASTPNTSNRASPSPPFSSTPRDPTLTPRLPPSHSPLHRSLLRLLPRCLRLDLLPVRRSSARSSPRRSAQVADAFLPRSVSGGLFNPAVSLGMFLVGVLTPMRAVLLTISQILGGITGSAIIQALLPGTLNVRTTLIPGMSVRSTFSPCELSRGRCADSRSSSPPCRSCEGSSSRCS